MDIKKIIDTNHLQTIQDLFSDATGLAAIAVDAEGNYITKGSNFTEFCMKYTRGCEEGLRRCVKCDNECTGTYFCHAGLMDFSTNIFLGSERVGAIIGGQVLPKNPDEEQFRSIARELGIDESGYINALRKVPIRSEKMIRASAEMLGSIVNQLVNLEYIKNLNTEKINVFDSELGNSLSAVKNIKSMMHELQKVASMEKILAINASVEAARSGQAGVGFAVVAREMGELSKSSASVYNQITENIDTVEKSLARIQKVKL